MCQDGRLVGDVQCAWVVRRCAFSICQWLSSFLGCGMLAILQAQGPPLLAGGLAAQVNQPLVHGVAH